MAATTGNRPLRPKNRRMAGPDFLLLDEPTNHLDIEAIEWLEGFLKAFNGAILFITHDRGFLQNLATRIIDLDRGRLTSWPGDYSRYLEAKQQQKSFQKQVEAGQEVAAAEKEQHKAVSQAQDAVQKEKATESKLSSAEKKVADLEEKKTLCL